MTTVYLNGQYLPAEEARIDVFDRGFLYADGVYEVIPVFNHYLFRLDEHIARLRRSLKEIYLSCPLEDDELRSICRKIVSLADRPNQSLYLQITRGSSGVRAHQFPEKTNPTVFVMSQPLSPKSIEGLAQGIKVITQADIRWERCDIKTIALLANVMIYNDALRKGADEAILIKDGFATEGCISNLFIVKNDLIITPPISHQILGGVTRDLILELAAAAGLSTVERDITESELRDADEIWTSSSGYEIRPVTHLDGNAVGNGAAGPIWHQLIKLYQQYKANVTAES